MYTRKDFNGMNLLNFLYVFITLWFWGKIKKTSENNVQVKMENSPEHGR